MKANEAPEKIYLQEPTKIRTEKKYDNDVEYTRTDSLIEKIENYLNSKLYDWVRIKNPDHIDCANVILKEDFIKDFKNYIKEE